MMTIKNDSKGEDLFCENSTETISTFKEKKKFAPKQL